MGCAACDRCGRSLVDIYREEIVTVAHDHDLQGIGASFYPGDIGGMLSIPQNPRAGDRLPRLSFRLTDPLQVQVGQTVTIRSARGGVSIAQASESGSEGTLATYIDERPVETPGWHFTDTSGPSFYLRIFAGIPTVLDRTPEEMTPGPSLSTLPYDGPPALLVDPAGTGPLNQGILPGQGVGALGFVRYLPFPSVRGGPEYSIPVKGPASIVLFASLLQTDPRTRPAAPAAPVIPPEGEAPETAHVRTHPLDQYRHLWGAILWEQEVSRKCGACCVCDQCCGCSRPIGCAS